MQAVYFLTLLPIEQIVYPDDVTRTWRSLSCHSVGALTLVSQCRGWLGAGQYLMKACKTQLHWYLSARDKGLVSVAAMRLEKHCTEMIGRSWALAQRVNPLLWQRYRYLRESPSAPEKAAELLVTLVIGEIISGERCLNIWTRDFGLYRILFATTVLGHTFEFIRVVQEALAFYKFRNSSMPLPEAVALLEKLVDDRTKGTMLLGRGVVKACHQARQELLRTAEKLKGEAKRLKGEAKKLKGEAEKSKGEGLSSQ